MATNNYNLRPFRLKPIFQERVWGRPDLKPWFAETGMTNAVGEAWLTGAECVIETGPETGRTLKSLSEQCVGTLDTPAGAGEFPLLVKILFPNEKLSVQVHPNDAEAVAAGSKRGKTECWYVLDAEPGATVMVGLNKGVTLEQVERAAADGTLESLLNAIPVKKGDVVFVDAGTIHAIGAGLVLLEVQQSSDVTYRMFDYGRGRDLHLADGMKVAKTKTDAGVIESVATKEGTRLIEEKYFVMDRFDVPAGSTFEMSMDGVGCVVGIEGTSAANEVLFGVGQAVVIPSGSIAMSSAKGSAFVRIYAPAA